LLQESDFALLSGDHLLRQLVDLRVAAEAEDHSCHVDGTLVMCDHRLRESGVGIAACGDRHVAVHTTVDGGEGPIDRIVGCGCSHVTLAHAPHHALHHAHALAHHGHALISPYYRLHRNPTLPRHRARFRAARHGF